MMKIMTRFASVVLPLFLFTLPLQSQEKAKTQEVVVDGAGTSADLALKDAFRNAVSQVVGALVDSDTLVKNDKLVEDNILTFSNGFIKTYTEVEGSKKFQSGIHRVKIKATVVTGSVVEKLKAAKITIKEVDGKGLFSEAMSKLESEKDAAALIAKHMKNFPHGCMKASVVGAPQIVEKGTDKIKTKFVIKVEPELQAYKAFATGLTEVLEKSSSAKIEKLFYYSKNDNENQKVYQNIIDGKSQISGNSMQLNIDKNPHHPNIEGRQWFTDKLKKPKGTVFIIGSDRNELGSNCNYKFYCLDSLDHGIKSNSIDSLLDFKKNREKVKIKFSLIDNNQETLISEDHETVSLLKGDSESGTYGDYKYNYSCLFCDSLFRPDENDYSHLTHYFFEISLELSPEELKKTKTAKVEILPK